MKYSVKKHILPALLVVTAVALAMPKVARLNFEYRKGAPWTHETLVAKIAFPIFKTEAQMIEERQNASRTPVPYYRCADEVLSSVVRTLDAVDMDEPLRRAAMSSFAAIYERGVVSAKPEQEVLYVLEGKRAVKSPAAELYTVQTAADKLLLDVQDAESEANVDSVFRALRVYDLIAPNLIYDSEMTALMASDLSGEISPTSGYVSAGQVIISEGEIVTPEIAQMLDSYKKEYNRLFSGNRAGIFYWIGCFLVSALLVLLLIVVISFSCPHVMLGWHRFNYILTVFSIAALSAIIVARVSESALFLVPFTLPALYLQAFFRNREIAPVYAVTLLPLLFFSQNGPALYVMFLIAGLMSIILFSRFGRGWLQFVMALITFGVLAAAYMCFFLTDVMVGSPLRHLVYLFAGSMATVALYPLIYLFEKVFGLLSSSRMEELCDTSNPLLQELEKKAPGTFQHSLQVMNMCDAVARSIGASVRMVRMGALYHDIGKVCNPLCFVENESTLTGRSDRYHSSLSPLESARGIIRHVQDGEAIALKYNLPYMVVDFIKTHHGTTAASFFLDRYRKEGGDPSRLGEFSYPGPKPSTREQIILMLCDSIEAASRTLTDHTPEAFDSFVEKIVTSKMEAGQFDDAEISVRELCIAKETLKSYLAQMYHGRVVYPEANKTNKISLWKQKQRRSTNSTSN